MTLTFVQETNLCNYGVTVDFMKVNEGSNEEEKGLWEDESTNQYKYQMSFPSMPPIL